MMNYDPDAAAAAYSWCSYNNNASEATAAAVPVPTSGEEASSFFAADMVRPAYSTDDLFGLDVQFDPPSEDEMAAWLCTIVKGDELACNDDGGRRPMAEDGQHVMPATATTTVKATNKEEKVATTNGKMCTKEMRKAPAGGSSRRSHHGEAHNLTEKRRRHKINERLKTLQQLVPGCSKSLSFVVWMAVNRVPKPGAPSRRQSMAASEELASGIAQRKSNQASTLDQTIHYMKSLQHQVQAMMSVGLAAAPAAVYPVVQPRCVPPGTPVAMPFPAAHPMVLGGHPPSTMVPLGTTMFPLPHYPAAAVMTVPPAVVAPLYPAAAPTSTADAVSANRLHEPDHCQVLRI